MLLRVSRATTKGVQFRSERLIWADKVLEFFRKSGGFEFPCPELLLPAGRISAEHSAFSDDRCFSNNVNSASAPNPNIEIAPRLSALAKRANLVGLFMTG